MWSEDNFIAGHLALDFLNTVGDTSKTRENNHFASPQALISWIDFCGLTTAIDTTSLSEQQVIDDLVSFRESAYQAVVSMLEQTEHQNESAMRCESYLKSALQRATFDMRTKPLAWQASKEPSHHVVDSFVLLLDDLLRSGDDGRIRQCERCSWLFLNHGRGRGRRWCNMATCGNRHKIQTYRERKRAN